MLLALGWKFHPVPTFNSPTPHWFDPDEACWGRSDDLRPNPTVSVDDALAMVGEDTPWNIRNTKTDYLCDAHVGRALETFGSAATPSLALCIAIVRVANLRVKDRE